jgi:putative PIN family toxin of toxin-antitoxin system
MQRVVLDTNVIVSSIWSEVGKPHKVVDLVFNKQLCACYCAEIFEEYEDVLYREKLNLNTDKVEKVLDAIKAVGVNVTHISSKIPLPDEEDRVFYDIAKQYGALLITGNRKHFPDEDFILTPTEFLELWGAQ